MLRAPLGSFQIAVADLFLVTLWMALMTSAGFLFARLIGSWPGRIWISLTSLGLVFNPALLFRVVLAALATSAHVALGCG